MNFSPNSPGRMESRGMSPLDTGDEVTYTYSWESIKQ